MANIQGNRIALEDVLLGMWPSAKPSLVQEKVGETRSPFYVRDVATGADWEEIQVEGYEVLVLGGTPTQQMGGEPAYIRFGNQGPAAATDTDITSAIPVLPGTSIPVPQGFKKIWFKASSASPWKIVISRVPHVHIDYGPYGYTTPPDTMVGGDIVSLNNAGGDHTTEPTTDYDNLDVQGTTIDPRSKYLTVQIVYNDPTPGSPAYQRLDSGLTGGPIELWWYAGRMINGAFWGWHTWMRNNSDDMTATAKGVASATHDTETYDCSRFTRLYLRDPTGWTTAAGTKTPIALINMYG